MRNKEKVSVLVVGARYAGAATAMLLARRGLDVLAIDRGGYGTDTLSTHALMRGGVLQLHRWGLLPRIVRAGTPALRATTFHYGDEAVEIALRHQHGVDALYAPRRSVLDRILVDAAREAGARVRHGWSLAGLIRLPGGRVAGAVLVGPEGERVEVAADLVVGADGIGSAVARMVGAPVLREGRHATAAIYGYWPGLEQAGYHWHYAPGASVAVIPTNGGPTNGGLHCVCVSVPSARFRSELRHDTAAGFRRALAEVAPGLAEAVAGMAPAGGLSVFGGRKGFMRRPFGPGWALVGDASYFKDPLTAHGITDALRDAELVAEAAADGSATAIEDCMRLRDDLSLPLFEVTDEIASFAWDLASVKELHRRLNDAMKREVAHIASLDAPGAGRHVAA
jgi:menaquinone-9 beta-reductase